MRKNEQGQSLVELVLVLPVIVWLIVGVVFLVELRHVQMVLVMAVHAAGREAAQAWDWRAGDVWRKTSREVVAEAGLDVNKLEVGHRYLGLYRGFLRYKVETPRLLRVVMPDEIIIRARGAEIP